MKKNVYRHQNHAVFIRSKLAYTLISKSRQRNVVQIFGNYSDWCVACVNVFSYMSPLVLNQNFVIYFEEKKNCSVIFAAFSVFTYAYINVKSHAFHRNHSHGKGHFWLVYLGFCFLYAIFMSTQPHMHIR